MLNINDKIQASLEKIRPSLQADGGDVELVSFNDKTGVALVRLVGVCAHCPMAAYTLKDGIETQLKEDVPEIKSVEAA